MPTISDPTDPHFDRPLPGERRCEWFATCTNVTTKVADHPVLGPTPCCDRCAKVVGATNYTPES